MDTTEEANGTYWYHGHANVTSGELFDLIFNSEQLADSLGITTEAVMLVLIGQPFIPVKGKLSEAATNTPGTQQLHQFDYDRRVFSEGARFPLWFRLTRLLWGSFPN